MRSRSIVMRLALAVASLALVLLFLEVGARIVTRTPMRLVKYTAEHPRLSRADLVRANVDGWFRRTRYRTNTVGLRGPDYSKLPARGTFRIAVAGDSVTVGSGVREEEAYPSLLEGLLNQERGARRVEVLNLGLGGLETKRVVDRLERVSGFYRFHLAVYGWTLNDIESRAYKRVRNSRGWREHWQESRRFMRSPSRLLQALWPRFVAMRERIWPRLGDRFADVMFNYLENPEAWALFESGLDRFASFVADRGICGHLLLHTHLEDLDADHRMRVIYDRVEAAARERGLSVTQSLPAHESRDARDLWVSLYDSHPNAAGHELLAQALREGLLHDLPSTCWAAKIDRWPPPQRGAGRQDRPPRAASPGKTPGSGAFVDE